MVDENLNINITTTGADETARDIKKVGDETVDAEEKITAAYRERIKAMYDIEKVSDDWIRQNKKTLDSELDLWEAQGKQGDQSKKNTTLFGKLGDKVGAVTLRKEQLVSVMAQVVTGGSNVTSSIGNTVASMGTWGLAIGAGVMALGSLISKQIEAQEAAKKAAAEFINQSNAMKEMGYGAIAYGAQLDEMIKKNREIGIGIALSGDRGGGERVSEAVDIATKDLAMQMEAQGKNHKEIADLLKANKPKIEEYARATEAVAAAQRELDAATGDSVIDEMKRKVLGEALNTAIDRQTDALSGVTTAFDGLTPAVTSLTAYFNNLRNRLLVDAGVAGTARRGVSGAAMGLGMASEQWRPGRGGGGGGAKLPTTKWEQTEEQRLSEWQLQLEAPGLYTGIKKKADKPVIEGLGDEKAVDQWGAKLAQETATSVAQGLVEAFTSAKPKESLAALFSTTISAVVGSLIGMGMQAWNPFGLKLATGGTNVSGRWRPFATGGSDFGSWVGSPMAIAGSKGNAIIGDVAGGEVVQNMPQIANMIKAVAAATSGGGNTYVYPQGLIGQVRTGEGVRTAYRDSQARHGKVSR